jgi:uncharacterized protein (TIGR00255 family)
MSQPVRSMTGYGRAERTTDGGRISVEMRSVNHRFLELNLNLPSGLACREPELRTLVASRLRRGRVDVWVSWERPASGRYSVDVDRQLLADLRRALEDAGRVEGIPGQIDLPLLARFSEAVCITEVPSAADEQEYERLCAVFQAALDALDAMRAKEGAVLAAAILQRIAALESAVRKAEEVARELPSRVYVKLKERLAEFAGEAGLDADRLHQELALLADKMDVTEEIVRLRSHSGRARELLACGGETGKRLDFLVQEMAREANTLGAKARGLDVADPLIEIKAEIEKVREQARNLE